MVGALLWLAPRQSAQQRIVTEMTPERIAEAIAAGENEDAPDSVLQTKNLYLGSFSTPFMRVAAVARKAKREYKRLKPEDVNPELIKPELHVYAWDWGEIPRRVQTVVITNRRGKDEEKAASAIRPSAFEEVPAHLRDRFNSDPRATGKMAVFPLDALSEDREVHVVFDHAVITRENKLRRSVVHRLCRRIQAPSRSMITCSPGFFALAAPPPFQTTYGHSLLSQDPAIGASCPYFVPVARPDTRRAPR